jgi:hypothetical protein
LFLDEEELIEEELECNHDPTSTRKKYLGELLPSRGNIDSGTDYKQYIFPRFKHL